MTIEIDVVELAVARSLIAEHLVEYFRSTETRRLQVLAEIQHAERDDVDVLGSSVLPGGDWRHKWPAAARAAIVALWRTPRDTQEPS